MCPLHRKPFGFRQHYWMWAITFVKFLSAWFLFASHQSRCFTRKSQKTNSKKKQNGELHSNEIFRFYARVLIPVLHLFQQLTYVLQFLQFLSYAKIYTYFSSNTEALQKTCGRKWTWTLSLSIFEKTQNEIKVAPKCIEMSELAKMWLLVWSLVFLFMGTDLNKSFDLPPRSSKGVWKRVRIEAS